MQPSLDDHSVRLVPLGGLGEIGMNCLAIEQADGVLVIDCGTTFPHADLGIDVVHPDFTWLLERAAAVRGVFLTHGHEDHIGALPYLLDRLDVPVWGSPHTLGLVQRRLDEHGFAGHETDLREARVGQVYRVGGFEVEPVRVTHSIVEASALRVETRAGTIVHTGDFNLDPAPPDGEPTDVARLRAIGRAGVRLLLSDSTNVDVPERPGSELEVGGALGRLIEAAPERVLVCMFASNIQRLMLLGQIAERSGRAICLLGRSLTSQVEVARRVGHLNWPRELLVAPEMLSNLPRGRVLILAGGSQAEANSAMRRLSQRRHTALTLERGDEVIFSSRIIPGNERPFFEMMCDLLRLGVRVHTRVTEPAVHTSGHAGRSEQRQMIEWLTPRAFVPVHGTLHHLLRHAELARAAGVEDALVVENGTPVVLNDATLSAEEPVAHGRVHIALGGEPMDEDVLRRRRDLGRSGVIMVVVTLSEGRLVGRPRVRARGVPGIDERSESLRALEREAADTVLRWSRQARRRRAGEAALEEDLRRAMRRRCLGLTGVKPVAEACVIGDGRPR